jgi:hypothetical protein
VKRAHCEPSAFSKRRGAYHFFGRFPELLQLLGISGDFHRQARLSYPRLQVLPSIEPNPKAPAWISSAEGISLGQNPTIELDGEGLPNPLEHFQLRPI